jgi:hypothetical protein
MADARRAAETRSTPTLDVKSEALQWMVVDQRGFAFQKKESKNALQSQEPLDFAEVWNGFITLVQKATKKDSSSFRRYTRADDTPYHDAESALKGFLGVMKQEHEGEEAFKTALLQALRSSLGQFCEPTSNKRAASGSAAASIQGMILLHRGRIGFGTEIKREESLRFDSKYGIGKRSKSDIACVVLRQDDVWDVTGVVELKIGDSSCAVYDLEKVPSWDSLHAPLIQALIYLLDAWHCLARRGQGVESKDNLPESEKSIPFAVVSARKKDKTSANRLCCMEGSLFIPEKLGERFRFKVTRCVDLPKDNKTTEADALYTQALAVFIKILSVGLSYAIELDGNPAKSAVTLCCSPSHPDLDLFASPIPCANGHRGTTIHQGELHKFSANRSISIQEWVNEFGESWEASIFTNPQTSMSDSLLKVSCKSVHNWLIPSDECWNCIQTIATKDETKELKVAMASVLYACLYCPSSGVLIMIMKNLTGSRRPEHFDALVSEGGFATPRARWEAFGRLVTNWLLPMARNDVIHYDIRFDPDSWKMCNVVRYAEDGGEATELALIDFESLSHYLKGATATDQAYQYTISKQHVGDSFSAFHFLFWQVLFIAYVWHPQTTKENLVKADDFAEMFDPPNPKMKVSEKLKGFKDAIGGDALTELKTCAEALSQRGNKVTNEAHVEKAMSVLHDIYQALP